MDIKVSSTLRKTLDELSRGGATGAQATLEDFKEMLDSAIDTVNNLQRNADKLTQQLATGELKDLHQVMIAVEEVNVALQLTMQIRNKIVEAYQEVMRMQV
ncbi:MAG TPA: flagellar hook-basal body complex protein FliE [Firmicutes bacterium]|mgnify:CR=1 FL=1|nr:flagellar hook-basal body complex protein FliE [Bacillota bacterium]